MKKFALFLLLPCLLLCGCTNGTERAFRSFSEALCERNDLTLSAEVTALQDDRAGSFTLRYCEYDGGCTVEVLAPELIAGTKARLRSGSATLEYDGVYLDTGDDGGTGLSPMNALPKLAETLRRGHLSAAWGEGGECCVSLVLDDHVCADVRFDESMSPAYAELSYDGAVCIQCTITDFR